MIPRLRPRYPNQQQCCIGHAANAGWGAYRTAARKGFPRRCPSSKEGEPLHDQDPFTVLGISSTSDVQAVRKAYRLRVRECHPDLFQNPDEQKAAQERLIVLNLAYEDALRICGTKRVGFNLISPVEAKHFAKKLLQQGNPESALRQLHRADHKDADFFFIQGNILMQMEQFETAYQSYREAVRRAPDENRYRRGALDASVAIKRSKTLGYKLGKHVRDILGKR